MACSQIDTGRGTEFRVMVLDATCAIVPTTGGSKASTLTVDNSGTPVAKGATTIPIQAIAANYYVQTGQYVGFVDPTTGGQVTVRATADAASAATSLTVAPTNFQINDASTADIPVIMGGRESASFDLTNNTETVFTFDSGSFAESGVTSITGNIGANGLFRQLDPGVSTVLAAGPQFLNLAGWIWSPAPSGFESGWAFRGQVVFNNTPVDLQANAPIRMNATAAFTGEITIDEPVVTP